ncbi:MAG: thioredoxin domain-containing protein [Promethearchaeota archaeon]
MEVDIDSTHSNTKKISRKEGQLLFNQLINEKSPYLLQHAGNPVFWYPWGDKAFEKAKKENKPIFLSIGYSTCHWCHVMAHESFEDPEIARMMNDTFINVKVDREERPDIDLVYMEVCTRLTGAGGWPLSIILTPDKKPFFAGTYFPKKSRFGQIGMKELIVSIKKQWNERKEEIVQSAEEITAILQQETEENKLLGLTDVILKVAFNELTERYDPSFGGFGRAPKFPTPHNLLFLLRYWKRSGNKKALTMVETTLQNMRQGGIYDQIGYGFHRYSTDHHWLVPHFEKMLYDQALISMAYLEVYQATGKEFYSKTAQEIFEYVLRDMADPLGGFYSAEDADSEGEEGKFYLWTLQEINQVLGKDDVNLAQFIFNIEKEGNYLEEVTRELIGKNILHLKKPINELASELSINKQDLKKKIKKIQQTLFSIRNQRVHPYKDDKILVDWNGLMIASLAKAGRVLNDSKYITAAKNAVDFILDNMFTSDRRLFHRYRNGEAGIVACLDDYAFLVWGLLELYETTLNAQYLKIALELNDDMIKHFWSEEGGFFFTAGDSEELLVRKIVTYDGAIPSGNSIAMLNLLRLGRLTDNSKYEDKAAMIEQVASSSVNQSPLAHTSMLSSVDFSVGPTYEVIIVGDSQAEDTREMIQAIQSAYIPNKVVIYRPSDQKSPDIDQVIDFSKNYDNLFGRATVYVCQNYSCKLPTTDVGRMLDLLCG